MTLHAEFRTHTMTVARPTRTSDGAGGWTLSTTTRDDVVGSLQPAGAAETTAADQPRAEHRWILYTDPDVDVRRGDHLGHAGRTFEVLAEARWEALDDIDHWAYQLEEIQQATT